MRWRTHLCYATSKAKAPASGRQLPSQNIQLKVPAATKKMCSKNKGVQKNSSTFLLFLFVFAN
jgi:hypothetical protein